jgi:hypothetical protein
MNITRIKRNLARFGIGNPLNALFYTGEEIKRAKDKGLIWIPPRKKKKSAF